jgi:hypothetical protein
MIFNNIIIRTLIGILFTIGVLMGLNKLFSINTNYKELILTGILIVLLGQIIFKVFKPYTFK